MSRYYDPAICRFINADSFASTGQGILGYNMFAYCRSNPVLRKDALGTADISYYLGDDTPWDDLIPDNMNGGGFWSSLIRTMQSAADGLNMAIGQRNMSHVEQHHLLSNKHQIYTPQYKEIADRYGYRLDHSSNIVSLSGHQGRHTNAYHDFMYLSITELDNIAAGSPTLFVDGMIKIGQFVSDHPWLPYAKYK